MNATDFRSLILAQPGMVAAIAARIYPVKVPAEVWSDASMRPCVVYRTEGVDRSSTFCGTIGLKRDTVQVSCYARTHDACRALAELVAQMVDFHGVVGDTHFATVRLESESDLLDLEPGLFHRLMTFTIWNRSA